MYRGPSLPLAPVMKFESLESHTFDIILPGEIENLSVAVEMALTIRGNKDFMLNERERWTEFNRSRGEFVRKIEVPVDCPLSANGITTTLGEEVLTVVMPKVPADKPAA